MKSNHKNQKSKYLDDIEILQKYFSGLKLIPDSPIDEYDCVISPLLSMIYRDENRENMIGLLFSEFNMHFGIDMTKDEAKNIIDNLPKLKVV